MTRIGRPLKYIFIIRHLDPNTLYCPASIARFALENDLLPGKTEKEIKRYYQRVRIAMGRFSNYRKFPDEGDGTVRLYGQPPFPAWFGWRWQKAMETPGK